MPSIEQYLSDFLQWYSPFLAELRKMEIEKIPLSRHKIRKEEGKPLVQMTRLGIYSVEEENEPIIRGTLDMLVEKEEAIIGKKRELDQGHAISTQFYFQRSPPFYALFIEGIEFRLGAKNIFAQFVYADQAIRGESYGVRDVCSLYFSPAAQLPRGKRVGGRGSEIHPHPEGKGVLRYERVSDNGHLSGRFSLQRVFVPFYAEQIHGNADRYLVVSPITVHKIGKGALTGFLDMVS